MYDKQIKPAKQAYRKKQRTLQNEKPDRNGPLLGERKNHILLLNLVNVSNITRHSTTLTKYTAKLNPNSINKSNNLPS